MRSVKFTASNGSTVTLDSSGSQYFITSIEGIDIPGVDSQTQRAPYQDGVTNIDQLLQPRDITIEGFIKTPVDLTLINTYRRALEAILNPKLGVGNIVYTYNSGSKQIAAKCVACTFANRNMPEPFQRFQIQFECPDPYLLSTTTDATSVGLVSALTKFPIKFDRSSLVFTNLSVGALYWAAITSDPSGNIWACSPFYPVYKCLAGQTTFLPVTSSTPEWTAICSDPAGNIWACATDITGSLIYKCPVGTTTFSTVTCPAAHWFSICSDPSGNIWAVDNNNGVSPGSDIYKCPYGSTVFSAVSAGPHVWTAITSDPAGNIWAGTSDSVIYKALSGTTTFNSTTGIPTGTQVITAITSDKLGNIWSTSFLNIYKCNFGSTVFQRVQDHISGYWSSICSDPTGNIWAASNGGDIFKCSEGLTVFAEANTYIGNWTSLTSDSSGNIWACMNGSNIYYCAYANTNIIGYVFSEVSLYSSRTITNNGDVPEPIIATVYGPAINPTLINETTGEFIHLIYTLNQGESLQINTAFGMKTITLNSGGNTTNGLQYLDPQSTFFQLIVGDNLMNLHDDTGSAQLRCDVGKIDRYVGI